MEKLKFRTRRNITVDIMKGIGIIMILWGHCRGIFSHQFVLLGVSLFFLISGFLYNIYDNFNEFFIKKFKRLYLPFILCNLFLPVLILIKKCILHLEIKENIIYIIKIILTLEKDGFLFGATWFLASLFLISVLVKFIGTKFKTKNIYLYIALISLLLVIISQNYPTMHYMLRRSIVAILFYATGICIKNNSEKLKDISKKIYILPLCLIILVCLWNFLGNFNYAQQPLINCAGFLAGSMCFIFCIFWLAKFIQKYFIALTKILSYLGENSIYLLIWHFVFIEMVTAFIMHINNIPLFMIESLPHVICNNLICVIVYFICAFCGSVLIAMFWNNFKAKNKNRK